MLGLETLWESSSLSRDPNPTGGGLVANPYLGAITESCDITLQSPRTTTDVACLQGSRGQDLTVRFRFCSGIWDFS